MSRILRRCNLSSPSVCVEVPCVVDQLVQDDGAIRDGPLRDLNSHLVDADRRRMREVTA